MIFRGTKVKGVKFIGKPTLSSIGDLIALWDYRKAIDVINVSGVDRVDAWGDISKSGMLLIRNTTAGRPQLYSDGVGVFTTTNCLMRGTPSFNLKCCHDGTAHVVFSIFRYNNPSDLGVSHTPFATGLQATGQGNTFSLSTGTTNRASTVIYDATGATVNTHSTANNSLPEDASYRLVARIFYGAGISNNSKTIIGTFSNTTTLTGTYATGNPYRLLFNVRDADTIRVKMVGAYNLAGKTASQIDAFITTFINTLKLDSEYASVITI